jgi:hypothetical protein
LFGFTLNNHNYDIKAVLAILNSTFGNYLLGANAFLKKETFPQIRLHWLKEFPIKRTFLNIKQMNNKTS